MIRKEMIITNILGLHVRAVSKLSKLACYFQSNINIHYEKKVADAKSVLGLLQLGAKHGTLIMIVIDGIDEEEALRSITQLIENRFGENE